MHMLHMLHMLCAMLEAFDEDHGVPRLRSSPQDGP